MQLHYTLLLFIGFLTIPVNAQEEEPVVCYFPPPYYLTTETCSDSGDVEAQFECTKREFERLILREVNMELFDDVPGQKLRVFCRFNFKEDGILERYDVLSSNKNLKNEFERIFSDFSIDFFLLDAEGKRACGSIQLPMALQLHE